MTLYLSKILPLFVYPVSLTLLLAGFAGLLWLLRWRRLAGFSSVLAVLVLGVSATPAVGEFLYGALERQHPPVALAATPRATDVRVVGAQQGTLFAWLPDVGALELTTLALKEWLGMRVNAWLPRPSPSPPTPLPPAGEGGE